MMPIGNGSWGPIVPLIPAGNVTAANLSDCMDVCYIPCQCYYPLMNNSNNSDMGGGQSTGMLNDNVNLPIGTGQGGAATTGNGGSANGNGGG